VPQSWCVIPKYSPLLERGVGGDLEIHPNLPLLKEGIFLVLRVRYCGKKRDLPLLKEGIFPPFRKGG